MADSDGAASSAASSANDDALRYVRAVRQKTFQRWFNARLAEKYGPKARFVQDLRVDLCTGIFLINLLHALYALPNPAFILRPVCRDDYMENVDLAYRMMYQAGINTTWIPPEDIVDKKIDSVLNLVWLIILHSDFKRFLPNKPIETSLQAMTTDVAQQMVAWCTRRLEPYKIAVTNLTEAFRNGIVLASLVHRMRSDTLNVSKLSPFMPTETLRLATTQAYTMLQIPALMDPDDFRSPGPDDTCVLAYLSEFLKFYRTKWGRMGFLPAPAAATTITGSHATSLSELGFDDYTLQTMGVDVAAAGAADGKKKKKGLLKKKKETKEAAVERLTLQLVQLQPRLLRPTPMYPTTHPLAPPSPDIPVDYPQAPGCTYVPLSNSDYGGSDAGGRSGGGGSEAGPRGGYDGVRTPSGAPSGGGAAGGDDSGGASGGGTSSGGGGGGGGGSGGSSVKSYITARCPECEFKCRTKKKKIITCRNCGIEYEPKKDKTKLKANAGASKAAWEIPYEELDMDKKIGQGAFGIVFRGKWRMQTVAIKQLLDKSMTQKQFDEFYGECELMMNLRPHKNIVQLLGICIDPNKPLCIVTDFVKCGSLYGTLMNKKQTFGWKFVVKVLEGITAGMYHLHSEKILHRDLAARNVLLSETYEAKVSDFGLSKKVLNPDEEKQEQFFRGAFKYMAPESLTENVFSVKSDMWSFGVVVWEVLTRKAPFAHIDIYQAARKIKKGSTLPTPNDCPEAVANLLAATWCFDPTDRPTFDQLAPHLATIAEEQSAYPKLPLAVPSKYS